MNLTEIFSLADRITTNIISRIVLKNGYMPLLNGKITFQAGLNTVMMYFEQKPEVWYDVLKGLLEHCGYIWLDESLWEAEEQ